jgi:dethiobiotin synthetase/malonyl-CoA O-methyltransferase
MPSGLFVTGTDTNVGKTVVCAALMHRYGAAVPLRYWKPVQTGIEQDDDTSEVRRLSGCEAAAGIRLPRPVSPHLAAKWSGQAIRLEELNLPSASGTWIVEGAGGVFVPLNETDLMTDLMRLLGLPILVVARSGLGTINHTLLTIEALRARGLCVAGGVMVGDLNSDNREAIEHYGHIQVLAEMPRFEPLDAARVAQWAATEFDPHGRLLEFLR